MLSFKFKKLNFVFEFSFFAVICLVSIFDGTGYILLGLLVCILHEIGHIIAMCLFDVPPSKLRFYCAGIKITPSAMPLSYKKELIIHFSGILLNLILFVVFYFITTDYIIKVFAVMNLIIASFNLIPFRQFDGGKIVDIIILTNTTTTRLFIRNLIRFFAVGALIIIGIYLLLAHKGNISLYISILYTIIAEFYL